MKTIVLVALLLAALCLVNGQISEKCMRCISQAEGGDKLVGKCNMDEGSLSCGPYQIKKPYWTDCGKPGKGYEECTKQKGCSKTCVKRYMKKYGKKCTGGKNPDCQAYARIHNGGPQGCKSPGTVGYGAKVDACAKG